MYHIIINPASQSGRGLKIWKKKVEPALLREGVEYQVHFSKERGDVSKIANRLASDAVENEVTLILLGGDGTVNELIQGLPSGRKVILGYIPTGSSNDLARDLGIPFSTKKALELILHTGSPRPMDLGTVTYPDGSTRRFCVSCGLGYDAAVCEEVQRSRLKAALNRFGLGKLVYLGIALRQLMTTKTVSGQLILDDNEPIKMAGVLFVAGMVHRYEGGGFMFCPKADPSDGLLDLCAVEKLPKLLILLALPTAFKGAHYRFKGITPYRAQRFILETSSPLWAHTDGEVSTQTGRMEVSCERHVLQIIAPATKA